MLTLKNSKAQAVIVLILVWLGAFIASYAQSQLAGMSVAFQEAYGFTPEQYAAIYSSSQFLNIWFAFFVGIISDKIGTRKIILIAAVIVAIAAVLRIFATSYAAQYACAMMLGWTGLFIAVNRAKILGGWFPPAAIALAVGIATTTTPVANTVGVGLTSMMPSITFAFGVTAVICVVFLVAWILFGKERSADIEAQEKAENKDDMTLGQHLKAVCTKPWVWIISLGAFFLMAGQVPVMAFTNAALINSRGFTPQAAGLHFMFFTIGMGVGSIVTPLIVKAIKAYRPIVIVYAVVAALCIFFGWKSAQGAAMMAIFFIGGWCLGSLLAMIFTWPVMVYGRENAATAGGIVQVFVLAGASLMLTNVTIPLCHGAGPEQYPALFAAAIIYVIVGCVFMCIVPDQGKKMAAQEAAKKAAKLADKGAAEAETEKAAE